MNDVHLPHYDIGLVFMELSAFNLGFYQSSSLVNSLRHSWPLQIAVISHSDKFWQGQSLIYYPVILFSIFTCLGFVSDLGSWGKILLFGYATDLKYLLIKRHLLIIYYEPKTVLASGCRAADKIDCPHRAYRLVKRNDIKPAGEQIKISYILWSVPCRQLNRMMSEPVTSLHWVVRKCLRRGNTWL